MVLYTKKYLQAFVEYIDKNKNNENIKYLLCNYKYGEMSAADIVRTAYDRKKYNAQDIGEERLLGDLEYLLNGLGIQEDFIFSAVSSNQLTKTNIVNSNYTSEYSKTYSSFSGSDMVAYITLPPEISDGSPLVIGNLQTLTYSIHREVLPVRALGSVNALGHTGGTVTIAGSMIFTMFDRNLVYDIQREVMKYLRDKADRTAYQNNIFTYSNLKEYNLDNVYDQYISMPLMPEFNIYVNAKNEYTPGNYGSSLNIDGVVIVDEGQVMSIEDIITENTMSYMARNIRPLRPMTRR